MQLNNISQANRTLVTALHQASELQLLQFCLTASLVQHVRLHSFQQNTAKACTANPGQFKQACQRPSLSAVWYMVQYAWCSVTAAMKLLQRSDMLTMQHHSTSN
jgi:hypothetical protein